MPTDERNWHDLTAEARHAYKRQVATMLRNNFLFPEDRWFREAIKEIGREWIAEHAADLLGPTEGGG